MPETPLAKARRILSRILTHPRLAELFKASGDSGMRDVARKLLVGVPDHVQHNVLAELLAGNLAKALDALNPYAPSLAKSWDGGMGLRLLDLTPIGLPPTTVTLRANLIKSLTLEAGQRWVTIHPGGKPAAGEEGHGVAVLIQEHPDGSATIIRGAGGKLTGLRLHHLASKDELAERSKKRAEQRKGWRELHRDLPAKADADKEYVKRVASALGWDDEKLAGLDDRKTRRQLVREANRAVDTNRRTLAASPDAVHQLLHTDSGVDASDLLPPIGVTKGRGYKASPDDEALEGVAPEATPDSLHQEIDELTHAATPATPHQAALEHKRLAALKAALDEASAASGTGDDDEKRTHEDAARRHKLAANQYHAEAEADNTEGEKHPLAEQLDDVAGDEVDNYQKAATPTLPELNRRAKDLQAVEQLLIAHKRHQLATRNRPPKDEDDTRPETSLADDGYTKADELSDSDVAKLVHADLADEMRGQAVSSLESAVDHNPRLRNILAARDDSDTNRHFRQHISAGASATFGAVAAATLPDNPAPRELIDALGIKQAAKVLAQSAIERLSPADYQSLITSLEQYHISHTQGEAEAAVNTANAALDIASTPPNVNENSSADEFEAALARHQLRRDSANTALTTLGTAAGGIEARAEILQALKRARRGQPLSFDLGTKSPSDAATLAAQLGLARRDYTVEADNGTTRLTLTPSGTATLTDKAGDMQEMAVASRVHAIEAGAYDSVPLHPQGFKGDEQLSVEQQRALRCIEAAHHFGLYMQAGGGKTATMLAVDSDLAAQGKVKRSIYAVPSIVQGQFGEEVDHFIDPHSGLTYHAAPGEDAESRYAAYTNPDVHGIIITHDALRRDSGYALSELAKSEGRDITPEAALTEFGELPRSARADEMKRAWQHMGWVAPDYLAIDEAHYAVRQGAGEDSKLSDVVKAHADNTPYVAPATGTPIVNNLLGAYSFLSLLDPARFPDGGEADFERQYKPLAARDSLKALWARYGIAIQVPLPVHGETTNHTVPLHPNQQARYDEVTAAYNLLAHAYDSSGKLDTGAVRTMYPQAFSNVDTNRHDEVARNLASEAEGILKQRGGEEASAAVGDTSLPVNRRYQLARESAYNRIVNLGTYDTSAKIKETVDTADKAAHDGKPPIVFARYRAAAEEIARTLEAKGHKVVLLTGSDNAAQKKAKRAAFNSGDADIYVSTDAGATGANLQRRGRAVIHHDVPLTSVIHQQRTARALRRGQTSNVEVHNIVSDTDFDRRAVARRDRKAEQAQAFETPLHDDDGLAGYLLRARSARSN